MEARVLNLTRSRVECELFENRPVRLTGACGHKVQCLSGTAWITAVGAAHDVFLRAGQTWVVPNDGLVLAEAVGTAKIRVETPRAACASPLRLGLGAVGAGVSALVRTVGRPLVRSMVRLQRRFLAKLTAA